jgi:3-hydroxypropanoate dehydrogenase
MTSALNDQSLDQIFRAAHTPNGWKDRPVEDATVREIYDHHEMGADIRELQPRTFRLGA